MSLAQTIRARGRSDISVIALDPGASDVQIEPLR
jgi:hypothetical protein